MKCVQNWRNKPRSLSSSYDVVSPPFVNSCCSTVQQIQRYEHEYDDYFLL